MRYWFGNANELIFRKLISNTYLVQQKTKQESKGIKNKKTEKILRVNSNKYSSTEVHLNLWRLAIRLRSSPCANKQNIILPCLKSIILILIIFVSFWTTEFPLMSSLSLPYPFFLLSSLSSYWYQHHPNTGHWSPHSFFMIPRGKKSQQRQQKSKAIFTVNVTA